MVIDSKLVLQGREGDAFTIDLSKTFWSYKKQGTCGRMRRYLRVNHILLTPQKCLGIYCDRHVTGLQMAEKSTPRGSLSTLVE